MPMSMMVKASNERSQGGSNSCEPAAGVLIRIGLGGICLLYL